jgi:hypothetical protein
VTNRREEERERLREARQERESAQAKQSQRRLIFVYAVAGVIGAIVLGGLIAVIASSGGDSDGGNAHINQGTGSTNGTEPDERTGTKPPEVKEENLVKAAKAADCTLRLNLPDEGATHIPPTARTPDYKTNPPTSGNHVDPPLQQADGAYAEMPSEIFIVHSLEHGRMEIQYSPDLSEAEQLELKGLYDTMPGGTLFFPNPNMDYAVATTTWTNLMGCRAYKGASTLDAIRAFGVKTWGKFGGEPVEAFGIKGATPADPSS